MDLDEETASPPDERTEVPEPPGWRWFHAAVGLETFGRPAGPWGALLGPVPLGAAACLLAKWTFWPAATLPWVADRAGEALYLLIAPFALATAGHAVGRAIAEGAWRRSEGRQTFDWSPRRWHYALAFVLALVPLAALQVSGPLLDWYLDLSMRAQALVGPMGALHVGYDPRLTNLFVAACFPLVYWQAGQVIARIPAGRLLGIQRELARLRGAVAWGPEAWQAAVEETLDARLADIAPAGGEAPMAGEGRRRHRLRWGALRKELVAAWATDGTPDLPRANRALRLYRESRP